MKFDIPLSLRFVILLYNINPMGKSVKQTNPMNHGVQNAYAVRLFLVSLDNCDFFC